MGPSDLARRLLLYVAIVVGAAGSLISLRAHWMAEGYGDFGCLWESGAALHRGADPYGIYPWVTLMTYGDVQLWSVNLNPPTALPLVWGLALLPVGVGRLVWIVVEIGALATAVRLLWRAHGGPLDERQVLALAVSSVVGGSLSVTNLYGGLTLLVALTWLDLRADRPWRAGVWLAALVAIKPFFAVWPVLLLLSGRWRPAAVVAGAVGALAAAVLGWLGPQVFVRWFELVSGQDARLFLPLNVSWVGLFGRLGAPFVGTGLALASLVAAAGWVAAGWLRDRPADVERVSALALATMLLASPLAWSMYTLFLLPVLLRWRWSWPVYLGLVLLAPPFSAVAMADLAGGPVSVLGFVYAGGFLLLASFAVKRAITRR